MAGIRSRYEFDSRDGAEYRVDIYDANFTGTIHTFNAGQGFNLDYESEVNKTIFSEVIFSKANIYIVINNDDDLTELNYLIENQSEEFIVEIYRNSSIFWRGIVLQDLIQRENRAYPFIVNLSATDGLKRLEAIEDVYNTEIALSIVRGLNFLIKQIGLDDNIGATDTLIKTANRWYEDVMPAKGTGIDPLNITTLQNAQSNYEIENVNGDIKYLNLLEQLRDICKTFKMRCLMVNGVFHFIQNDQYAEGVLYLHSYPKNYPTSSATVTTFDPDVVPIIEAGGVFSYTPEVGIVKATQDLEDGGRIINYTYRGDWQTKRTLAAIVAFNSQTQVELEFLYGPVAEWAFMGTVGLGLKADFEIKIILDATYYLTNKTGQLTWSTTSADVVLIRTNNVYTVPVVGGANVIANLSTTISTLTFPALPVSGDLELQILATVIDPTGAAPSGYTLSGVTTGLNMRYVDPTNVDGVISYRATRTTESSFVYDNGKFRIGDKLGVNFTGGLLVFNGSGFVYGSNWQRQGTGTAHTVNQLGLYQVLGYQNKPLEVLNGRCILDSMTALSRVEKFSKKYILNRASFNANLDTWDGSWVEIISTPTTTGLTLDEPRERIGGPAFSGKFARPNSRYFDLIENAAFRITNTSADATGTITTISIDAAGFDIDNTNAKIVIVHPETGENEELTLVSDFLSDTTTLTVSSTDLSNDYPTGSYIYMSIGQVLQKVFDITP